MESVPVLKWRGYVTAKAGIRMAHSSMLCGVLGPRCKIIYPIQTASVDLGTESHYDGRTSPTPAITVAPSEE